MRIWKNAVSGLVLLVGGVWASLALALTGTGTEGPHVARGLVAVALVALAVAAWRRRSRRWSVAVMLLGCLSVYGWVRTFQPSNSRDWAPDLVRAPWAEVAGMQVTLHDVRDFRYRSTTDWDPAWYTATYDTAALTDASFIVEPFSGFYGAAHTMVSFGFQDGRHVVFSVEVRREQGETFSALGGLFRRFEITYVVGDERDLVQLRSNFRHDDVYVYPVNASKERITAFFMDMVQRMNGLHTQPEFYDTLTSNCTTNLVRHFEKVATKNVPYDHRTLMPAFSDALAYELGIIDTDAPLEQVRQRYHINARALAAQGRDDFSARIRAPLETAAAPAP
ncbi:Lnb N-terminal periplasmic domain-containing protein [Corallococcus exiguus]|uniref:Lnb N-terminal periplasmic domain-containing protein n=1 Tax=Corallococcus exiguus TaxID=83462 RepID=UPI003DA3BE6D